jgi:hypothetical protein
MNEIAIYKSAILECGVNLAELNEFVDQSLTAKIHLMVDLVDGVMKYTKYDEIYLPDIFEMMHVIERMTFLQTFLPTDNESQGLPYIPGNTNIGMHTGVHTGIAAGYIDGLPNHWYGTIERGYIRIVTRYGKVELSININITTGTASVGRKDVEEIRPIWVELISVADPMYSAHVIDIETYDEHAKIVYRKLCNHPKEFMNAIRRVCAGTSSVFMKFETPYHTYEIQLERGEDLEVSERTFVVLENAPVILISINDTEYGEDPDDEIEYQYEWRRSDDDRLLYITR